MDTHCSSNKNRNLENRIREQPKHRKGNPMNLKILAMKAQVKDMLELTDYQEILIQMDLLAEQAHEIAVQAMELRLMAEEIAQRFKNELP